MARKQKVFRKTIRVGGKPITMRFSTKAQADTWYAQMKIKKENARAGVEMPIEPLKMEVACANLIVDKEKQENFENEKFRIQCYLLAPFFGRHIHTITRQELKDHFRLLLNGGEWSALFTHEDFPTPAKLQGKKRKGLAPKTLNDVRTLFNLLYKAALQNEPPNVRKNQIDFIPRFETIDREMPHWESEDEMKTYLHFASLEHTSFWIFAMIALNTGMREGEIIALKWEDINFRSDSIRIYKTWATRKRIIKHQTKTKKDRRIGITEKLKEALLIHRERTPYRAPSDHVVYRWKTGRVTDSKTLWEIHSRVIRKAGIKYINVHGLRHTFATQYLAAGGNLYDLKNILGHATITMTEKYAHLVTGKMKARASVFQIGAGSGDDVMMTTEWSNNANNELH